MSKYTFKFRHYYDGYRYDNRRLTIEAESYRDAKGEFFASYPDAKLVTYCDALLSPSMDDVTLRAEMERAVDVSRTAADRHRNDGPDPIPVSRISIFELEESLIPFEQWEPRLDEMPQECRDVVADIEPGVGIGHRDDTGWFVLCSGQGPFLHWMQNKDVAARVIGWN